MRGGPEPRMQVAPESGKGRGMDSFLKPVEGMELCQHLAISPDPFWTSDLQNRKVIHLWCFKPLNSCNLLQKQKEINEFIN